MRLDYKKESRKDWGAEVPIGTKMDREQITLGCVLRIADAMEKMANAFEQNITGLVNSRIYYQELYTREEKENQKLKRQIIRLKKKLVP